MIDDPLIMHDVERRYRDAKAAYQRKLRKSRKKIADIPEFGFD
jgi:hypothetical protein